MALTKAHKMTANEALSEAFNETDNSINVTGADIETAVQLIDDIVYVDDADWTTESSKHALVGGLYQSTPQTVTDGDVAPIEIDVNGKIIESNSAAIKTAVEIMDDWDETDRAKVNLIVGQAGIAAGTGVDGVTVPRVSLATNVPLPAGTNAIGKLVANSGVDIGDVDVLSIAAGDNNIGNVDIVTEPATAADGTGTLPAVVKVVGGYDGTNVQALKVNSDGELAINLETADIEIGAVEIKNGTTDERATVLAASTASQATDTSLVVAVHPSSPLPAGTNAIGKLVANSGVDIGDVDVTSVPAPLNVVGTGTEATALRVTIATDSTGLLSVDDNSGSLTIDNADITSIKTAIEKLSGSSPVVTNATGNGAITTSYAPAAAFWLESVTLHLSAAPVTSEVLTITLNANDGVAYDTVLLSQDLSANAVVDLLWLPSAPVLCENGDAIDIAFTNTDVRTYGLRIVARLA